MTLIKRIERVRFKKNGEPHRRPTVRYQFRCDSCQKTYEKKPGQVSVSKTGYHFCCRSCRYKAFQRDGVLRTASEETSMKNYGVTSPMKSIEVMTKRQRNMEERWGVGVTAPLHVPGAKEKRRRTHLEHYGVEETFQSSKLREKRNKTWRKNLPRNYVSKPELRFKETLELKFNQVRHQHWVNGWPIDFYVEDIDTYVQFDGVYWHGLNRPIEVIRESQNPRDQSIYRKWLTDREQDKWFKLHGLRLIRVTDRMTAQEALDLITNQI